MYTDYVKSRILLSLSIQLRNHLTLDRVITRKLIKRLTEVSRCSALSVSHRHFQTAVYQSGTHNKWLRHDSFIGMRAFFIMTRETLHEWSFMKQMSFCSVRSNSWYQDWHEDWILDSPSIKTNTQSSWASSARTLAIRDLSERTESALQILY